MNKILVTALLLLVFSVSFSQEMNIQLRGTQSKRFGDYILVGGIKISDKTYSLNITLYDKNLVIYKEFSKVLPPGDNFNGLAYFETTLDEIKVAAACKGKCPDYYLVLDKDLNEKGWFEYSDSDKQKFIDEVKAGGLNNYMQPVPYFFSRFNIDTNYLDNDWFQINYAANGGIKMIAPQDYPLNSPIMVEPAFAYPFSQSDPKQAVRRYSRNETKYANTYKQKWEAPLDEKEIFMADFIHLDEKVTIAFIASKGEGKRLGKSFLYILDSKTGNRVQKVEINPESGNEEFYFTKGIYDPELKEIFIAGNSIDPKYKSRDQMRVSKLIIIKFDLTGKQLDLQKLSLPDLSAAGFKNFKVDYQFPLVKFIKKSLRGEYTLIFEDFSPRRLFLTNGEYTRWVPVGVCRLKLDSLLNLTSNSIFLFDKDLINPIDKDQEYYKYYDQTSDGKKILMSLLYKGKHIVKLVDLSVNKPYEEDLYVYDSSSDADFDNFQYLMDDHTIIIYHKINKDNFELKSIKF
ncbi:MAG: hypothetical protein K0Q95_215 [Bacteroidota bacterium]|jgi:hypothetical protein|nr:hypothetical protein [Bacteroidota bacterium]